nr:hypothetical protein [uncultured Flavobacterium sp.]
MITRNQYLEKYPIAKDSEKLIVGTIHPHDHDKFMVPFFYGNKASIWAILNEVFNYTKGKPITLESILQFLQNHKISVSDTIVECRRKKPTALDNDLIPLLLNHQMIEQIRDSNITEIIFTSSFQKNNAFKLFYVDILGLKITPEIKRNREVVLDKSIFGRPVKLTILYSPSGAANIALSTSRIYLENKHKYQNSSRPVYDFKIDYYREKFGRRK